MSERLLVKRRWTDSSLVINPVFKDVHPAEQYSTNGRMYTINDLTSDVISFDKINTF